jgi:hypothetical protein
LKSKDEITKWLPHLHAVLADADGNLATLAMELISISSDTCSTSEIEKALEKVLLNTWSDSQRIGVYNHALAALRKIDTVLSREIAKTWRDRNIFGK